MSSPKRSVAPPVHWVAPTAVQWAASTPQSFLITRWLLSWVPRARRQLAEQILRFSLVGGFCTTLFSLLYLGLAAPLGNTAANTVAMFVTAVLNTALNRRHTFRAAGTGAARHHAQGMVILALNWILSTGSLAGLRIFLPAAAHLTELLVLTGANLGGTLVRFILLRTWVFRGSSGAGRRVVSCGGTP